MINFARHPLFCETLLVAGTMKTASFDLIPEEEWESGTTIKARSPTQPNVAMYLVNTKYAFTKLVKLTE
jgi:hypothetical protein